MEKILSKILEVDRKAKEELGEVKKIRLESQRKSSVALKQKRIDYIERAKENIKKMKKKEKTKAYMKLKRIENKYSSIFKKLDEKFQKSTLLWVDKVVERVINS